MNKPGKYKKYLIKAKALGALHAIAIKASDVAVDPRVLLKCMYGCPTWNKNWTCPSTPKALRPREFEQVLKRYRAGILIHCDDKKLSQDISFEIERDAFLDGFYLAFSMSDCTMCKECAYPDKNCRFPKKARPAMQGLGIDVYATVRKFGLPLKPLKDHGEPQNWYSLVLLE